MSASELLCQMIGNMPYKLTKRENLFLEAELFMRIHDELKEIFKIQHIEYLKLQKLNIGMEDVMLEGNFIRLIINDILLTEEYTLEGIACYTQTSEDVIHDIAVGNNLAPSFPLSRKIIEIHRTIRPDLYNNILKKILSTYTS